MKKAILAVCVAGTFLMGNFTVMAAPSSSIDEKVTVTPERTANLQDELVMSSAALKVLRHIAQARDYIHQKDQHNAAQELSKAQTLIEIIKTAVPREKIKDRIWVANKHLSYENTETVMQDLIPIYASFDEIKDFTVKEKVKNHVNNAKKHLENGNKKGAADELKLAGDELLFMEIDLPLLETEKQIINAEGHLANKELKKADASLKMAEDGVILLSVAEPTPAQQAKRSFWQATKNYTAGKIDAAKADLKKVKEHLAATAKTADEKTKAELDKIAKDVDSLDNKISKFDQKTEEEFNKLYQRIKSLI